MIGRILQFGKRIFYLGIAVVGLSMAVSGYPPETNPSSLLVVGGILTLVGIAGVIWPEKMHSGSPTEGG